MDFIQVQRPLIVNKLDILIFITSTVTEINSKQSHPSAVTQVAYKLYCLPLIVSSCHGQSKFLTLELNESNADG